MKDYLGYENERNKKHAATYERFLRAALKGKADKVDVLIGHHICFELNGELATENEIPSADCLMFDHELMFSVFGLHFMAVMSKLATTPVEKRDEVFADLVEHWVMR